jgi:membrane protease YdiL (CAAX protease family)
VKAERIVLMEISKLSGQSTAASRSLRQLMKQHPLFFFFLMSYAFSWIILVPYVLSVWGILRGDFSLQWYLFILLGIPALILLGIIIQPGMLGSFQGITPVIFVKYLVYFVVVFFGVALPEEIGWRGFALPRMQPRYGPLWGTLLLGVLWAFWHLLYFLTPGHGGGPGTTLATYLTNFSYFFLMVVAFAIIFTWVFNHTQGSIFVANLAHAAIDTPQLVWIPLFLAVNETRLNLASLIAFGVPALLIVILTRGRLGYRSFQGKDLGREEVTAQPNL